MKYRRLYLTLPDTLYACVAEADGQGGSHYLRELVADRYPSIFPPAYRVECVGQPLPAAKEGSRWYVQWRALVRVGLVRANYVPSFIQLHHFREFTSLHPALGPSAGEGASFESVRLHLEDVLETAPDWCKVPHIEVMRTMEQLAEA